MLWVTESHTSPVIPLPFSFCPPASSLCHVYFHWNINILHVSNIHSLYKYPYTVKTDLFIRRWNMYMHLHYLDLPHH